MPYKDPEKAKICKRESKKRNQHKYRVSELSEEQRLRNRWNNKTIPELIRTGIVDWEGNILRR